MKRRHLKSQGSSTKETAMLDELRSAAECEPIDAAEVLRDNRQTCATKHWLYQLPTQSKQYGDESSAGTTNNRPHDTFQALITVLESRHSSIGCWAAPAGPVLEVLNLLSLKRSVGYDAAGRRWESRFYPSSGGTHCIEPLLYASDVDNLERGWYRQTGPRSREVEMVHLPGETQLTRATTNALRIEQPPSAIVFAVADPDIHSMRYPDGMSLLWRDAGAFLAVAQLCATALGLSASIAGISHELSDPDRITPPFVVGAVGLAGHPYTGPSPIEGANDVIK
jgi:hypothetical protein